MGHQVVRHSRDAQCPDVLHAWKRHVFGLDSQLFERDNCLSDQALDFGVQQVQIVVRGNAHPQPTQAVFQGGRIIRNGDWHGAGVKGIKACNGL